MSAAPRPAAQRELGTVVFDLDGTLLDTVADIAAALGRALRAAGLPALGPVAVRGAVGAGGTALARAALVQAGQPADPAAVRRLHERYLAEYLGAPLGATRPYPGALQAVARLARAGVRLAICTNKPQPATLAILDGLGLRASFAAVVGVGPDGRRKPDPRPLLAAITGAHGTPETALLIGDTEHDAAAALAAGVAFLPVAFGYGALGAEHGPPLAHFDQLEDALAELGFRPPSG